MSMRFRITAWKSGPAADHVCSSMGPIWKRSSGSSPRSNRRARTGGSFEHALAFQRSGDRLRIRTLEFGVCPQILLKARDYFKAR